MLSKTNIPRLDLGLVRGSTFSQVIRWETEPFVYAAISSIAKRAPARIVTQADHNLPDGWRVAVVSAKGLRDVNAANSPPCDGDFHRATVIDTTTVDLNDLNTADLVGTHTAGSGYLQFYTPVALAGCTGRMTIRSGAGDVLLSLTTENSRIAIDAAAKTITLTLSATETAALTWTRGAYDLEIEDGAGVVTKLYRGTVTVTQEETT